MNNMASNSGDDSDAADEDVARQPVSKWKTLWIPIIVVVVVVVIIFIVIGVVVSRRWKRGNDPNDVLLTPLPGTCRFPKRQVQRSLSEHVMQMCDRPGGIDCRNTMTPKHAERLSGGPPKTLPGVQREIDSSTYLTKLLHNKGMDVARSGELRQTLSQYLECSLDMIPMLRQRALQVKDKREVNSVLQQLHNLLLIGKTTLLEGEYYKAAAILSRVNGQLTFLTRVISLHDSPYPHRSFGSYL